MNKDEFIKLAQSKTPQELFEAFVDVENKKHAEFCRRRDTATSEAKRLYWAKRASGLTTSGGQTRLDRLLALAKDPTNG